MLTLSTHRVNGFVFKQPLIPPLKFLFGNPHTEVCRFCFQLALSDECIDRFGFHLQYLGGVRNGIGPFAKFLARWRAIDLMIFDLIGIPFLKAGNNDTPFVVYQNDFKEILMK